jgi:repressor of nif and glnA expression
MTGYDDKILEVLGETGAALSKKGIQVNAEIRGTEISYSTVKRRLPKLVDAGLVKIVRETGPYYRITDLGREYLGGDLDVADLDD